MKKKSTGDTYISVIVPRNPFVKERENTHCLCAFDVQKLMDWWPGLPHTPHRDPAKVSAIQRSLDWKRVTQIAAYLLQEEILDAPTKLKKYFEKIYEPKKNDPGREWPPKIGSVAKFARSSRPSFSNVLVHINGADLRVDPDEPRAGELSFNPKQKSFNLTVIDGQHRINGAFLALKIMQENKPETKWDIGADVFLDLDASGEAPKLQAQIFIDVNFYQKKVDRSLVADLFPTARGDKDPLDYKERAQDIGRRLMLEVGPLVGMVQIPGIRYGVKDVVTLATLVSAIERVLPAMDCVDLTSLDEQTEFLAQALEAWLSATGRQQDFLSLKHKALSAQNVVYQGRVLVSALSLVPAMLVQIAKEGEVAYVSKAASQVLGKWLKKVIRRAGFLKEDQFIDKDQYKLRGFLGSGGIGRFRNRLWAATKKDFDHNAYDDAKTAELAKQRQKYFGLRLTRIQGL